MSIPCPPTPGTARPACAPYAEEPVGSPLVRSGSAWTFGVDEMDGVLPGGGLWLGGVHELRPASHRDHGAAIGFALALIGRRLALAHPQQGRRPALLLWALTDSHAREHGRPYGPGLTGFGIDLLLVQAARGRDLAFALEEGLKSRALAAVLGQIDKAPALFARRLALAARASRIPCLIVSEARAGGMGPALTRWRVGAARSGPNPYDAAAPGLLRWRVVLERCRWGAGGGAWTVEWSDDAYRFRLATPMADRAPETGEGGKPLLASA